LEREFAVHRTEQDYAAAEFWKWALSIMIGATMGTLAFLVDWGIDVLNTSKYTAVNNRIYGEGALKASTLCPCRETPYTVHCNSTLCPTGHTHHKIVLTHMIAAYM